MPDNFTYCETLVREADKDRFLATLFAPAKHRRPLFALYAFNIEIARVRAAAREPLPGEMRLQWWRDVFVGAGQGEARANPVAAALLDTVVRYRLPLSALTDFVDAHTFDLYNDPMPTVAALEGYARKTSAALMAMAALILNDGNDPGARQELAFLGMAQMTAALLIALPLHAARGQLYVPLDLLERHGVNAETILAGKATAELRAALAEMRLQAKRHLAGAKPLLAAVPPRVLPALLPAALIRPTLDRMERRSYDPFRPSELPQWRRQWILWRAARRGLASAL
jgi:phytoene synthase